MDYQIKIIDKFSQNDMELYTNIAKLTKSINELIRNIMNGYLQNFFQN